MALFQNRDRKGALYNGCNSPNIVGINSDSVG